MSLTFPPSARSVEEIFEQHDSILRQLPADAVSDRVALDNSYRKVLILSSASYLETLMTFHMTEYFRSLGGPPYEFARRFALDRKFFQWFDFEAGKPDKLFSLFGTECKARYREASEESETIASSGSSFMLLCSTRNDLVHNNLAEMNSELSVEDIRRHFRQALEFPDLAMRVVRAA